ncbi:hypothetical protein ABPG74_011421 [Tetrahymena malaccensis]
MDQIVQQISIQFSTIPEILAYTNSVFALLLTFGFIFRIFSQKEIRKDFFYVFLQNMYQDSYQKLLKANKLFKQESQCQHVNANTKPSCEQDMQEIEKNDTIQLPLFESKFRNYRVHKINKTILLLMKMIKRLQNLQTHQTCFPYIVYNNRFQFKWSKIANLWQNKKKDNNETYNFELHKALKEQQINKQLNILELYKDLLFVKKSIMIFLSKEQLAAMQLVGYSYEYQRDQMKFSKENNQKCKSYLEEQQDILNWCDLQCKYVQQFFQKFQNNNGNESNINKRIISTIIQQ